MDSIPMKIPFLMGWTSINPSYFDVNKKGVQGFDTLPDVGNTEMWDECEFLGKHGANMLQCFLGDTFVDKVGDLPWFSGISGWILNDFEAERWVERWGLLQKHGTVPQKNTFQVKKRGG